MAFEVGQEPAFALVNDLAGVVAYDVRPDLHPESERTVAVAAGLETLPDSADYGGPGMTTSGFEHGVPRGCCRGETSDRTRRIFG